MIHDASLLTSMEGIRVELIVRFIFYKGLRIKRAIIYRSRKVVVS